MENDDENTFVRLGDAVRGIVDRLEVTTARPPVPTADAALFVLMLREVYGPLPQGAARRRPSQIEPEASE